MVSDTKQAGSVTGYVNVASVSHGVQFWKIKMVLMCLAWELWFKINVSHIKKIINYSEKNVFIFSSITRVMPQIRVKAESYMCRCLPCWFLPCLPLFSCVVLWSHFAGGEATSLSGGSCSDGARHGRWQDLLCYPTWPFPRPMSPCSLLCHRRGLWGAPQASSAQGPPWYHHIWCCFALAEVKALPASRQRGVWERAAPGLLTVPLESCFLGWFCLLLFALRAH